METKVTTRERVKDGLTAAYRNRDTGTTGVSSASVHRHISLINAQRPNIRTVRTHLKALKADGLAIGTPYPEGVSWAPAETQ